jgi:hypothetical protein
MRKIITLCAAILITSNVFAQAPEKMSYQAVIRNSSNALVTNSIIGMRISILQTSPTGTAVYVETQTPTTNINGLVSIEIGNGTIVTGNFSSINWANGPYFVKTETDPSGGTNYSITGTSQLLSTPYALHAKTAGAIPLSQVLSTGNNANNNNIVNVGKIGVGTSTPSNSAALEINSTTGSLLIPRMTTTQRDILTGEPGMLIYNTTVNKFQGYASPGASTTILHNDNNAISSSTSVGTDSAGTPNYVGQSFIPASGGILQNINVNVNRASSDPVTCSVYSGIGYGGTLLGQVNTTLSSTGTFVIDMSSQNINLIAGQNYSFRLYSPASFSTCPIIFHMTNFMDSNATYPNGTYLNFQGNPDPNADLWFEIFIGNLATWINLH